VTSKHRDQPPIDWRTDWWLWPAALLLTTTGLGQSVWMWDNTHPEGLAPLWLLLWVGVGAAGLTLPLYWLARRWFPVAWVTLAAWAALPAVHRMATEYDQAVGTADEWLYSLSPLLFLLLLGLGLSGALLSLSWYLGRRWSGPPPRSRPFRQGFWSALFVVICGWLLINRVFAPALVILLGGALLLIEAYLIIRESPREQDAPRKHQVRGSRT
jgi:hypothetical protein